ncbi:hypothetical protein [uncultured Acetatifactor sp.]|uniref:hypothetical protein n=1 Tax=uncultured Acetatifactor sp. TaxID=1671927 RepID=UPI00262A77F1|nr:hypothetical protein [uncultured Acetatifactor sp.]
MYGVYSRIHPILVSSTEDAPVEDASAKEASVKSYCTEDAAAEEAYVIGHYAKDAPCKKPLEEALAQAA